MMVAPALPVTVGRLQIAMDDPFLVRRIERLGNLARDPERFGERQRATRQAIGECRSVDQFENQRGQPIGFLESIDSADVRVVERGEHPRFACEPCSALRVGRQVRRQDLDRDITIELAVAGAIDLAHAAGAKRGDDCVRAEPSAYHRRPMGRSGVGGGVIGQKRALRLRRRRRPLAMSSQRWP